MGEVDLEIVALAKERIVAPLARCHRREGEAFVACGPHEHEPEERHQRCPRADQPHSRYVPRSITANMVK